MGPSSLGMKHGPGLQQGAGGYRAGINYCGLIPVLSFEIDVPACVSISMCRSLHCLGRTSLHCERSDLTARTLCRTSTVGSSSTATWVSTGS